MKLTICRLDASFFLTERTISWIMQSMTSFVENVSREDLSIAELGASTAYAYYARAAYDNSKNASNLSFEFDKKYIFKPDRDKVKGMENPNSLSSWCRLMGFLNDDDGTFAMGEFAKNFIANNLINTKEVCLVILSKQWVVVDEECKRNLLGVIHELVSDSAFLEDLSEVSSSNTNKNKEIKKRLQKAFFSKVVGHPSTETDEIQFTRFDALRNTLLLAGILSSDMNGKVFVSKSGANILKDFYDNESRLSTYNPKKVDNKEKDFHRHMSSIRSGFFEIIQDDNIDLYKSYTNLIRMRNYVFSDEGLQQNEYSEKDLTPVILYGPPGTGKTYKMQTDYISKFHEKNTFVTTFHQSFSYEEFVEGLKPVLDTSNDVTFDNTTGDIKYKVVEGIFRKACEKAAQLAGYTSLSNCISDTFSNRKEKFDKAINEKKSVLLCIDEINRGNIAAIFGDLISLIEKSKRLGSEEKTEMIVTLPYSQDNFGVPANLLIVGTMNTADRSIQLLDTALRRRFKFEEILPDYNALLKDPTNEFKKEAKTILEKINVKIRCLLNKDNQIGHSYFINVNSRKDIFSAIVNKVIPLLEEYFYNDIKKVRFVLNENKDTKYPFYIEDNDAKDAFEEYVSEENIDSEENSFYVFNKKILELSADEDCNKYLLHLQGKVESD